MNYPVCIRVLCCFTLVAAYGYRVYSQTRGGIPLSKECCRLIPSEPNEGDCCLLKFPDARFHDFFTDEQVSKRFQSVGVPTCCGAVRANDGDEWVCARLTGSTSATAKTLDGRVFVPEELLTVLKLDEGRYLAVAPQKDGAVNIFLFEGTTNSVALIRVDSRIGVDKGVSCNGTLIGSCASDLYLCLTAKDKNASAEVYRSRVKVGDVSYRVGFVDLDAYSSCIVASVLCLPEGASYPETDYMKGIVVSEDCGKNWRLLNIPNPDSLGWLTKHRILGVGIGDAGEICFSTDDAVNVSRDGGMSWKRISSDAKMDKMCVRKGQLYLTTRNTFPSAMTYCEVFDVDTGALSSWCSGDDALECNWSVLRESRILEKHTEPYAGAGFYGNGWIVSY